MVSQTPISVAGVKTRFLIISDTHGIKFQANRLPPSVDVAIHCGDLTQHSKLDEFRDTIQTLKDIDATLKLVIAGNHDFSLDIPVFRQKIAEANKLAEEPLGDDLVKREFGDFGAARRLLKEAKDDGIILVDEGAHQFTLRNGAVLKIYASPYTPSTGGEWGFQYTGAHEFDIEPGTDVVITHGPPHGIMDMTGEKKRVGCPQLFSAIAKAQPQLHCFGHVHEGWGAKLVAWRPKISEKPSHFSDIDHERSLVIESLPRLRGSKFESAEDRKAREDTIARYELQKCCKASNDLSKDSASDGPGHIERGRTLFVNAALQEGDGLRLPWLVDMNLPAALQPDISTARKRRLDMVAERDDGVAIKRTKGTEDADVMAEEKNKA